MKPTLLGAAVMALATLMTWAVVESNVFANAPSWYAEWFLEPVLWVVAGPTLAVNKLFHLDLVRLPAWPLISLAVVINTLLGALLGWVAGKICRAWMSRRHGGESL